MAHDLLHFLKCVILKCLYLKNNNFMLKLLVAHNVEWAAPRPINNLPHWFRTATAHTVWNLVPFSLRVVFFQMHSYSQCDFHVTSIYYWLGELRMFWMTWSHNKNHIPEVIIFSSRSFRWIKLQWDLEGSSQLPIKYF